MIAANAVVYAVQNGSLPAKIITFVIMVVVGAIILFAVRSIFK